MTLKSSSASLLLAATLLPPFTMHAQAPAPQETQPTNAAEKKKIPLHSIKFDKIVFKDEANPNDRGAPYARFIINNSDMAVYVDGRPLFAWVSTPTAFLKLAGSSLASPNKQPDGFDPDTDELVPGIDAEKSGLLEKISAEIEKAQTAMRATLKPTEEHHIMAIP